MQQKNVSNERHISRQLTQSADETIGSVCLQTASTIGIFHQEQPVSTSYLPSLKRALPRTLFESQFANGQRFHSSCILPNFHLSCAMSARCLDPSYRRSRSAQSSTKSACYLQSLQAGRHHLPTPSSYKTSLGFLTIVEESYVSCEQYLQKKLLVPLENRLE